MIIQCFKNIDYQSLESRVQLGYYNLESSEGYVIPPESWEKIIKPGISVFMKMWPEEMLPGQLPPSQPGHFGAEGMGHMIGPHTNIPVDSAKSQRQIPLHEAIKQGNPELFRLLLRYGADARVRGSDGRSVLQAAKETNREMADMIKDGVTSEGPSTTTSQRPKDIDRGRRSASPRPRPTGPPRNSPKWHACQTFEATVIEFSSVEGQEKRILQTVSLSELLYGKGPSAIFGNKNNENGPPIFTWYHLPANNVCILPGVIIRVPNLSFVYSYSNLFLNRWNGLR